MNSHAVRWALYDAPMSRIASQPRDRLTLIAMAARAQENRAVTGTAQLAKDLNLSVTTVGKSVKSLEELGLIKRMQNGWTLALGEGEA